MDLSDKEFHRTILVTQAMRSSKGMKTSEWINSIKDIRNSDGE